MQDLSPNDARAIAAEAYLYAYPMLANYRTLFQQAVDPTFPGYVGGFNRFRHYARGFTPADRDIVTPSNDTPYSWAWLDLRAEPMVVTAPAFDGRYFVMQWFDLYTHNFGYIGPRATGPDKGDFLIAGPRWTGEPPDGVREVIQAETDLVGTLTRTAWSGPEDRDGLVATQRQYRIRPLSEYVDLKPPAPSAPISFPAWDERGADSVDFLAYLNFLLQFAQPVASEAAQFGRFARIGVGPGLRFDAATLSGAMREGLALGVRDGQRTLKAAIARTVGATDLFGSRAELGEDYILKRAVGAAIGIYGNTMTEALYAGIGADADRRALDGAARYVLHFDTEQIPNVEFFWSMTLYDLPDRALVDNPIDRYAIGSRTPGLVFNADGSLDILLQSGSPGAALESNWLPSPKSGPYYIVMRMYGPRPRSLHASQIIPPPRKIAHSVTSDRSV